MWTSAKATCMTLSSIQSSRSNARWAFSPRLQVTYQSCSLAALRAGCPQASRDGHTTSRQVQKKLDCIATRTRPQEVNRQDKAGNSRHRIHPHMLRHSFSVWSLDGGVPVGDLQDQLGHASLPTTGILFKVSPDHRREEYMRPKLPGILAG